MDMKHPTWLHWILATTTASVMMLSYVHGFVFPRTEAELMSKRIDRAEQETDSLKREIKEELRRLNDKVDRLMLRR